MISGEKIKMINSSDPKVAAIDIINFKKKNQKKVNSGDPM
jgi:hypothetical protein